MREEKFAAATAAPGLHGWVVSDTSSVSAVKKKKRSGWDQIGSEIAACVLLLSHLVQKGIPRARSRPGVDKRSCPRLSLRAVSRAVAVAAGLPQLEHLSKRAAGATELLTLSFSLPLPAVIPRYFPGSTEMHSVLARFQ